MFEKKITPYQNLSILIIVSFAFQIMSMPVILSQTKGPVGWIAVIGGAAIIIITIKSLNNVMKKYTDMTVIDIAQRVLPKFAVKLIGTYYIVLFFLASSILLKDFAEQIKLLMLFKTPKSLIIIIILFTASYAAKKGIQTIAQISHLSVIFGLLPFMAVIMFSAYYSNYTNLLPLYPIDVVGLAKTVPFTVFGFLGYTILLFSNSYVNDITQNTRLNKKYIYISSGLYILCYALIIVKFGRVEGARLVWPFLSIMKFVNIPGFFLENTEAIGISFQIITIFTCLCILMYFTNLALQKTLATRENGYYIYIQIPILFTIASALPGMHEIYQYLKIPAYIFSSINIFIPILIIVSDKRKNKVRT